MIPFVNNGKRFLAFLLKLGKEIFIGARGLLEKRHAMERGTKPRDGPVARLMILQKRNPVHK